MTGFGIIECQQILDKSTITTLKNDYPLKLIAPKTFKDDYNLVYALTYGGGLLPGDAIDLNITVQSNCNLFVSSPTSTKVYKQVNGLYSAQRVQAAVMKGALLAVLPEPVTLFKDSHLYQKQDYSIDAGGSLIVLDWICSGRYNCNERWQFNKYESQLTIKYDGNLVIKDDWLLKDGINSMTDRMSCYNSLCNIIILGPKTIHARNIALELNQRDVIHKQTKRAGFLFSVSPIICSSKDDNGIVVRAIATETDMIRQFVSKLVLPIEATYGPCFYQT